MGLVAGPPDDAFEIDDRYPAELAERRTLLATRHADVFAACPGTDQAAAETLSFTVETLTHRHPTWFRREGPTLTNHLTNETWDLDTPPHHPLELAGRLVQEDLCLIDATTPTLQAAILCAPSRWRLSEKIGRPLADVHEHVPLYADRLARPVDRFMTALRPGKLAIRLNWSIVDDPALFQQGGKHQTQLDPSITPENAPCRLHLRVERQTLTRLPSATILFAIRVHSYPLHQVLAQPGAAPTLAAAIRALPPPMAAYKSLPAFQAALLKRLDATPPADRERGPG